MPNFHMSAEDIRLDDGHILRCRLQNLDGEWVDAELDLNNCIGNHGGAFKWGSSNFAKSAEDISFAIEGADSVPVLRATMPNSDGETVDHNVNLAERIDNNNGTLVFDE